MNKLYIDQSKMRPQTVTAMPGEDVRFFCSTRYEYTVKWTFQDGQLLLNVRHYTSRNESVLLIESFTLANVGTYECIGQLERPNDEVAFFAATATLQVSRSKLFFC